MCRVPGRTRSKKKEKYTWMVMPEDSCIEGCTKETQIMEFSEINQLFEFRLRLKDKETPGKVNCSSYWLLLTCDAFRKTLLPDTLVVVKWLVSNCVNHIVLLSGFTTTWPVCILLLMLSVGFSSRMSILNPTRIANAKILFMSSSSSSSSSYPIHVPLLGNGLLSEWEDLGRSSHAGKCSGCASVDTCMYSVDI